MSEQMTDDARVSDALRFYIERVAWSSSDRRPGGERDQYLRLFDHYTIKAREADRA